MKVQNNTAHRKIFLGGLRYSETEQSIYAHFEQFGKIESVLLPKDKLTGKPRGFGFVTFKNPEIALALVSNNSHMFNGRYLDIKMAKPRSNNNFIMPTTSLADSPEKAQQYDAAGAEEIQAETERVSNIDNSGELENVNNTDKENNMSENAAQDNFLPNRIFVGGLPDGATNAILRQYFSKFGTVIDSFVLLHAATKRPRGFGFVTFKEESIVPKVISNGRHEILGKKVETRLATTRSEKRTDQNKKQPIPNEFYHPAPPYPPPTHPTIYSGTSPINLNPVNNVIQGYPNIGWSNANAFRVGNIGKQGINQQIEQQVLMNVNLQSTQPPYIAYQSPMNPPKLGNIITKSISLETQKSGNKSQFKGKEKAVGVPNADIPQMKNVVIEEHQQVHNPPGPAVHPQQFYAVNYSATYAPNASTPYYSFATYVGGHLVPNTPTMSSQQMNPNRIIRNKVPLGVDMNSRQ